MRLKNRILSLLLVLAMVFSLVPSMVFSAGAAGGSMAGSGTADDPYIVEDAADLAAIANNLSAYYMLKNDIAPETWTSTISTSSFSGTLDGNGYTITLPEGTSAGLFSNMGANGKVKNLRLVAPSMTTSKKNGGMLADSTSSFSGSVYNCAFIGSITVTAADSTLQVGAITGYVANRSAKFENCYAAVTVTNGGSGGSTSNFGALIGRVQWGNVTDCLYDSTLMDKSVGLAGSAASITDTGLSTADLKAAADTLNAHRNGLLSWENDEKGGYPDFAEHTEIQTGSVTLTGTLKSGETVTAEDTFTSQHDRTYHWYRVDGAGTETLIEGAEAKEYVPTDADVGYKLKVVVLVANAIGGDPAATSDTAVEASASVKVTFKVEPADAKVAVRNAAGFVISGGETEVTLPATGEFTYFVGRDGYQAAKGTVTTAGADQEVAVTLAEKTITGWSSEETYNMLIGDRADMTSFPAGADEAVLKWAVPTGTSYSQGEPSNPVFAGGNLYVVGYNTSEDDGICLKKIDTNTGAVLAKVRLTTGTGFNYFLTTAEDMLFIMEGGRVEAFSTDLVKLWQSEVIAPGQGLCPINYADGYLYGGTCRADGAGFFCLSAADGSVVWFNKAELKDGVEQGHYWAGGVVLGDWVVYGSDCARLYVANRYTGAIKTKVDVLGSGEAGNIRSSIAYADGSIFFTTTKGYIVKAPFDAATGTLGELTVSLVGVEAESGGFGRTTTATPVVYNGRVYVGSSSYFAVFDESDLSCIYRTAQSYNTLRDLRLVADKENDCVYVFTTYYSNPGSVVMYTDKAEQTEASEASDFSKLLPDYAKQYNASMPIFGPDGTIYASNDRGYLAAYARPGAYLTELAADAGKLAEPFSMGDTTPELIVPVGTDKVTLTLAANEGAEITVDGEAVTDGKAEIALPGGVATVTIVTTKGTESLTYTLSIREVHTSTGLSVVTSTSNNISSSTKVVAPYEGTDDVYLVTSASGLRTWFTASDDKAVMSAPEMLTGSISYTEPTSTNSYLGLTYTGRFYSSSASYPVVARVTVTAEDGTAKPYYIVLLKDASYDGTTPLLLDVTLNKTELTLSGEDAAETLTASSRWLGEPTAADKRAAWSVTDETVAKVDGDGTVTAMGNGTATITATVGGISVKCTVNAAKHTPAGEGTKGLLFDEFTCADCGETYRVYHNSLYKVLDVDPVISAITAEETDYPWSYIAAGNRLESGNVGKDSTASQLKLTFTAQNRVTLSLDYGVSSEEDCDKLNITLDGADGSQTLAANVSGEKTGAVTQPLEAGTYTLTLEYKKDGNTADGSDMAWLNSLRLKSVSTVYMTCSGADGAFVTGSDEAATVLSSVPVYASDLNGDGKVTVDEAFVAMHRAYCTDGIEGYLSAGGYISRFWGEDTYNVSYTVNDKAANSTNDEVRTGDRVNAWNYQDTAAYSDLYVYFPSNSASATVGQEKVFSVSGLAVMTGTQAVPAGATVTVYDKDGAKVDTLATTVGADGTFRITFPNKETYTVEISGKASYTGKDFSGNDAEYAEAPVVPARCIVQVAAASTSGGGSDDDTISVKVRLIGATQAENGVDIAAGVDDSEYVTWIATRTYTLSEDATVYDLFTRALDGAGLEYVILNGSWVQSITAPQVLGGYELAEMDNGSYSGWMYTVNGIHVQNTLDQQKLKDDDVVIWHYINDYRYEDSQWATGSQGNETYWDRWLKAPDVNPGSNNGGTVPGQTTTKPGQTTETSDVFDDVAKDAWYRESAERLAKLGLVKGNGEKKFSPDVTVSRAMFVTLLGRLYELDGKTADGTGTAFADVAAGQYYSDYVAWGAKNGLVQGYADGRFAPDDVVTREQMALFLFRYAKLAGQDVSQRADLAKFADGAAVSDYAADAMSWAVAAGLMQGTGSNKLTPQGSVTRSQLVVLLDRFLGPEKAE